MNNSKDPTDPDFLNDQDFPLLERPNDKENSFVEFIRYLLSRLSPAEREVAIRELESWNVDDPEIFEKPPSKEQ